MLVQQSFIKEDAQHILKIALPRIPSHDKLLWHFDKRGECTVQSAYQVALNQKFPYQPNSSKRNQTSWSIIWTVRILEKIKIFMWKVVRNLLPTTTNLWKKKCATKSLVPEM